MYFTFVIESSLFWFQVSVSVYMNLCHFSGAFSAPLYIFVIGCTGVIV